MKNETKRQLWEAFLKEHKKYFRSDDEKWYESFQKVKNYINQNKKKPSITSENKEEKYLGLWINTQTKNYKKKQESMKDETKYNLWTQFLEEYKQYFPTSITETETETIISCSQPEQEQTEIPPPPPTPPKKKSDKPNKPNKSMKLQINNITLKEESQQIEPLETKKQRIKTEISILHQRYKTMKSINLQKEFQDTPELWNKYHEISEENEKSFPEEEIPRNRIIQELNKIKTKRQKIVVDMGCGKGHIAEHFKNDNRFQFLNYDHVSSQDTIISCDISNLPLEDDSVEICILSLAMWGSNCREYILEAHRVLETSGKLYIIEPTKRWSEQDEHGNILPEKEASKMKRILEENGFRIIEENIEKFCLFQCMKI